MPETPVVETPAAPAAPETPPVETPEAPAPGEDKKQDEKFASKFAALSRKEKQLLDKERSFKEQEARYAKLERLEGLLKSSKENPLKLLEEAGLSFDDLANHVLSQGKEEDPATKALKRIEALETERAEEKKKREERELNSQREYIEKTINWYKDETGKVIAASPEDFELILANNAQDEVWNVIEEYFYQTGEILNPADAAKKVEDFLLEESKKLLSVKKLAPLFAPTTPGAQETKTNGRATSPAKNTLTNSQTLPAGEPPSQPLSKEERMKRALEKLQFRQ